MRSTVKIVELQNSAVVYLLNQVNIAIKIMIGIGTPRNSSSSDFMLVSEFKSGEIYARAVAVQRLRIDVVALTPANGGGKGCAKCANQKTDKRPKRNLCSGLAGGVGSFSCGKFF